MINYVYDEKTKEPILINVSLSLHIESRKKSQQENVIIPCLMIHFSDRLRKMREKMKGDIQGNMEMSIMYFEI